MNKLTHIYLVCLCFSFLYISVSSFYLKDEVTDEKLKLYLKEYSPLSNLSKFDDNNKYIEYLVKIDQTSNKIITSKLY